MIQKHKIVPPKPLPIKQNQYSNRERVTLSINQRVSTNLESLIKYPNHVQEQRPCVCPVCQIKQTTNSTHQNKNYENCTGEKIDTDGNKQTALGNQNQQCLNLLLEGLTPKGQKSLRICIPSIVFFEDNHPTCMYYTSPKELTIKRLDSVMNVRLCQHLLTSHRIKYLQNLVISKINNDSRDNTINPEENTKITNQTENKNKSLGEKKKQVSHNHLNNQIIDSSLNSGKVSSKDSHDAYLIKYCNSNIFQQINESQFRTIFSGAHKKIVSRSNISPFQGISYIALMVNPFHKSKGVLISEYSKQLHSKHPYLERADLEYSVMTHEIGKYDERYVPVENFEIWSEELKKVSAEKFLLNMTCRIVVFISKSLQIKTDYLKIRWVVNSANQYYLIDVLEWRRRQPVEKRESLPPLNLVEATASDKRLNPLLINIQSNEDYFISAYMDLMVDKSNVVNEYVHTADVNRETKPLKTSVSPTTANFSPTAKRSFRRNSVSSAYKLNTDSYVSSQTMRVIEFSREVHQMNLKLSVARQKISEAKKNPQHLIPQKFRSNNLATETSSNRLVEEKQGSNRKGLTGPPKRLRRALKETKSHRPRKYFLSAMKGMLSVQAEKQELEFPILFQ